MTSPRGKSPFFNRNKQKIPFLAKSTFLAFLAILVPTYWATYGPSNFLWYSDVLLFLAFLAALIESKTLASMAACGGLVFSLLWILSVSYSYFFGLNHYMLDPSIPFWIRGLSLFHVALFPLLLWLVKKLGYDQKGWIYQVILTWVLAFGTWSLTTAVENINFVYSYVGYGLSPFVYLAGLSAAVSTIVFFTHLLLARIFPLKNAKT